ncbi:hypothetical protein BH24DEI2_BH24DEI2_20240 [soil metagenome]
MKNVVRVDPDIMSGAPVFEGTRVMVSSFWDYLETGQSVEAFLDDFPSVSLAQTQALLAEARSLMEAHARSA